MAKSGITSPPYTTYTTFLSFINGLRKSGIPSHITKDILPGSASGKATIAASLRYLKLVSEDERPTQKLTQLVENEGEYSKNLRSILEGSYPFLTDGSIDLKTTTTDKLVERFKSLKATSSTITKCVSFFLSACKDAGIEVSPYVKAPPVAKNKPSGAKRSGGSKRPGENDPGKNDTDPPPVLRGYTPFEIPIPGAKPVKVAIPESLNESQWTMLSTVLDAYLSEFKRVQLEGQKSNEPVSDTETQQQTE